MSTPTLPHSTFVPESLRKVINSLPARQPTYTELGSFNKTKFTSLMFTVFAPDDGDNERHEQLRPTQPDWCDELVFQAELCPTTGRLHWQCYAHSSKQIWGGQWLKHFKFGPGVTEYEGTLYWRNPQRPENHAAAKAYCQKLRTRAGAAPMPMPMPTPDPAPLTVTQEVPPPMPMPKPTWGPTADSLVAAVNPSMRKQVPDYDGWCVGSDYAYVAPCVSGRRCQHYVYIPDYDDVVCMNCVNGNVIE